MGSSSPANHPELLQHAIAIGKSDIVNFMLDTLGADPSIVPVKLDLDMFASARGKNELYRQSPFIIQAAASGNWETFKAFSNRDECDIETRGHIVLSRARFNAVSSNVIGAAAYFGKAK